MINREINKQYKYPGIGYLGAENVSGLYGMSGGIIDEKGTGIQHLFYRQYKHDLIHTACTMVRIEDRVYYGNRVEYTKAHQRHIMPEESQVIDGYMYYDRFVIEDGHIEKHDYVAGVDKNKIVFKTVLVNKSQETLSLSLLAYANINPFPHMLGCSNDKETWANLLDMKIRLIADDTNDGYVVKEAPTGFLYRTTQTILRNEIKNRALEVEDLSLSLLREKRIKIEPMGETTFTWMLVFEEADDPISYELERADNFFEKAAIEWQAWFLEGNINALEGDENYYFAKSNLMAMKASLLDGFVPADLTGHYFANKMPCYYARDAMMIARGFLSAGHFKEFRDIMIYLIQRSRKTSGEFYQRYNGIGEPDEGANNNIFHQLDSIGFFLFNIRKYYELTGEMLIEYEEMLTLFEVLEKSDKRSGLIGIEGGVNEGVYGGAYITSSNAFIYGGLNALLLFVLEKNDEEMVQRCKDLMVLIESGIESTYIESEGRYAYGYVAYSQTLVKKYDTPLYFGVLYGWKDSMKMRSTHEYYETSASYFEDGIGYSEQEYHHGPWLFNTMAAAQYCSIIGDRLSYQRKMDWANRHSNGYGLMPEAIDGEDEKHCFINPLTWACSEYVSAAFITQHALLEKEYSNGTVL